MKKIIALLLALIMAFSFTSVLAFAEGEGTGSEVVEQPTEGEETEEPTYGGYTEEEILEFIMNAPIGTVAAGVKVVLKLARVALKFVMILDKLHIIDLTPVKEAIYNAVADAIKGMVEGNGEETPEVPETPVDPAEPADPELVLVAA